VITGAFPGNEMSRDPLCSFQTEDGLLVEGDGVNVLGNCERRGLREQLRALAHRDADQKHGAARLAQGRFERHRSGRHGLPGLAADEQEHALGVGAEEALLPLVWLHVHAAHEGCGVCEVGGFDRSAARPRKLSKVVSAIVTKRAAALLLAVSREGERIGTRSPQGSRVGAPYGKPERRPNRPPLGGVDAASRSRSASWRVLRTAVVGSGPRRRRAAGHLDRVVVDGKAIVSEAKTGAGRRSVPLDVSLVALLRSHRARQAQERLAAGEAYSDGGFILANELGVAPHPDSISKWFDNAVKAAKFPRIRLHDTRHTAASPMLASGVPTKVVSEMLGYASPTITLAIYATRCQGWARGGAPPSASLLADVAILGTSVASPLPLRPGDANQAREHAPDLRFWWRRWDSNPRTS